MAHVEDHVVFIAGASDTDDYKATAKEVINEINQSWGDIVPFRVIGKTFEDVQPGRASYPQEVINKQIRGKVDTFTGILKAKNGTSTPKYSSGTSEEIYGALHENEASARPELLIYRAPVDKEEDAADPKLLELIASLSEKGVLYHPIKSEIDFERKYRIHLINSIRSRKARELAADDDLPKDTASSRSDTEPYGGVSVSDLTDEERNFYRIAEWATDFMPIGLSYLEVLRTDIQDLSDELGQAIDSLQAVKKTRNTRAERFIMTRLSSRLMSGANSIEVNGKLFHLYVGLGLMALDIASRGLFQQLLRERPRLLNLVDNFLMKVGGHLEQIDEAYRRLPDKIEVIRFESRSPAVKASRVFSDRLRRFLSVNELIVAFAQRHHDS